MPAEKLKSYLDENAVKYVTIRHSPAYTASEIAQSAHIPGRELAKTVMVKVEGELGMVVLPASQRVDTARVSQAAGGANVMLAKEEEFRARFPGCEVGGMPPFGNLYGMKVYLSPKLAEDEEIAFNAGSHTELIRMKYADFERLAKSAIVPLPAS
jgi:Ala-tRNA(Pro) deacylase